MALLDQPVGIGRLRPGLAIGLVAILALGVVTPAHPSSAQLSTAATGVVLGRVITPAGLTVADIEVTAIDDDSGLVVGSDVTAADGRYAIDDLPAGVYHLEFEDLDEQYLSTALPSLELVAGRRQGLADVVVRRGRLLGGTVISASDRGPIEGVTVLVRSAADDRLLRAAQTTASGDYLATGLPFEAVTVEAVDESGPHRPTWYLHGRARAGATEISLVERSRTGIDVELSIDGSVLGTVSGRAGRPVAGALVQTSDPLTGDPGAYAIADDAGFYLVPILPAGSYRVEVVDPAGRHFGAEPGETVEVGAGAPVRVDVSLRPAGFIAGTISDTGSAPVPGAEIEILDDHGLRMAGAVSDTGGDYLAGPLEAGDYRVRFSADGYLTGYHGGDPSSTASPVTASPVAVEDGIGREQVDGRLVRPGWIEGTVIDRLANPIPGAVVVATGAAPTRTEADGRYRTGDLRPGNHELHVTDPFGTHVEHRLEDVVVGEGRGSVGDVVLERSGLISGRVTDDGGTPVPFAQVSVLETTAGPVLASAVTGFDGGYVIRTGLPAGDHVVYFQAGDRFRPQWYRQAAAPAALPVVVLAGTVTEGIDAVLVERGPADDRATTEEDVAVDIDVLANDDGPAPIEPATLTIVDRTATVGPSRGTAVVGAGGLVRYTPDPDRHGQDMFRYSVCDEAGRCRSAAVSVTIDPVNDAPVAVGDAASTGAGRGVIIDVVGNDSDVDGDGLTVASVTPATGGTVSVDEGMIRYQPAPGFCGFDRFRYTAADPAGATSSAPIVIGVACDPPAEPDGPPPEADESPPEADGAPPDPDRAPPEADRSPPEADDTPPDPDGAPPEADRSPPEADDAPPDPDGAPPEADGAPSGPVGSPSEPDDALPEPDDEPAEPDGALPEPDGGPIGPAAAPLVGSAWFHWPGSGDPAANHIDDPTSVEFSLPGAAAMDETAARFEVIRHRPDGSSWGLTALAITNLTSGASTFSAQGSTIQGSTPQDTAPLGPDLAGAEPAGTARATAGLADSGSVDTAVSDTTSALADRPPQAEPAPVEQPARFRIVGIAEVRLPDGEPQEVGFTAVIDSGPNGHRLWLGSDRPEFTMPAPPESNATALCTGGLSDCLAAAGPHDPPPTESLCPVVVVRFEDSELWNRPGRRTTTVTPVSLPCDRYEVRLQSSDLRHRPGHQVDQRDERWILEGLDAAGAVIYTSPPTDDLPDHLTTISFPAGAASLEDVAGFRARHLGAGGINSVNVAATLAPIGVG